MGAKVLRSLFLIFLVGGFACLLLFLGLSDDRDDQEAAKRWEDTEEDLRLEGVHYQEWKDGSLVWVLDAREGKYYHGKEEGVFRDVSLSFVPASGGRMTVYADRVLYEIGPRELVATGNVWGRSDDGYRFYTDSLSCDLQQRRVKTPEKVTVKKDRLTIEGVGMEGSLREQTFELLSSVRTVFVPPEQ